MHMSLKETSLGMVQALFDPMGPIPELHDKGVVIEYVHL